MTGGLRALFLSYDGMTDPLGGSQVLPYLEGLSARGHEIHILSCEKPERSAEHSRMAQQCADAGISWHPIAYHRRPPVLSTVYDVAAMKREARRLHACHRFDLLHCRSYIPALAAEALDLPFLFDMRGLWADERVDGGLWPQDNPLYRSVYRFFKEREKRWLHEAAHVVSLTEAGKDVLLAEHPGLEAGRISVIPCCTDEKAFPPVTPDRRAEARALLGITAERKVAAYLGSIGTWYLLGEMLDFFREQLRQDPGALFLMVSQNDPEPIRAAARERGIGDEALLIRPASRSEVPLFLAAADYGLFFIKRCYSKLASSPVKLGEFFALELPIVTNQGVGDVDRIVAESGAGVLVKDLDQFGYARALQELRALKPDRARLRSTFRRWFDLPSGVQRYDALYRSLGSRKPE